MCMRHCVDVFLFDECVRVCICVSVHVSIRVYVECALARVSMCQFVCGCAGVKDQAHFPSTGSRNLMRITTDTPDAIKYVCVVYVCGCMCVMCVMCVCMCVSVCDV